MNGETLFRREAVRHNLDRLHGEVSIATPVRWQIIGFSFAGIVIVAAIFLTTASYSRVETVPGTITLNTGVIQIKATRSGVIAKIEVQDRQDVRAGQPLIDIRAEEDLIQGSTAPEQARVSLELQRDNLDLQKGLIQQMASAEKARLSQQIVGLGSELESLEGQIADQQRLVAISARELASAETVAKRGFVSQRDVEARESLHLQRRQELSQLQQMRSSKRSAMAEAERSIAQSAVSALAQSAGADAGRAALVEQFAEAQLGQGYTLTAPLDGSVTALTARLGQRVAGDETLLMVVPHGAKAQVELMVPSSAAGFISVGQEVRIAVDAYPYQRFGTIKGHVTRVSGASLTQSTSEGPRAVYLVTAALQQDTIMAFGRSHSLVPGMTLSARIVTDRRSLIEWLFEPLFAVVRR